MGHAVDVFRLVDVELVFLAYSLECLYSYRILLQCHGLFLLFAVTCRHLCWLQVTAIYDYCLEYASLGWFFCFPPRGSFLHTRVEKHRFLEQIFTFENLVLGFSCGKWRGFGRGYMGLRVRIRHFWVTTHAVVVDKRPIREVPTRGFWGKTRLFSNALVLVAKVRKKVY